MLDIENIEVKEATTAPEKVTTITELLNYKKGKIVPLPPFAEGQPFYARLQRPSLMNMVKNGVIPNELVIKANELFTNKALSNTKNVGMLPELLEVLDVMAESVFVEPTYKEIKDAGIELTDEQLLFVFSYAQAGVRELEKFRTK